MQKILVDKAAKKVTGIALKWKVRLPMLYFIAHHRWQDGQEETIENLDACVLALGAKGMKVNRYCGNIGE